MNRTLLLPCLSFVVAFTAFMTCYTAIRIGQTEAELARLDARIRLVIDLTKLDGWPRMSTNETLTNWQTGDTYNRSTRTFRTLPAAWPWPRAWETTNWAASTNNWILHK